MQISFTATFPGSYYVKLFNLFTLKKIMQINQHIYATASKKLNFKQIKQKRIKQQKLTSYESLMKTITVYKTFKMINILQHATFKHALKHLS